MNLILVTPPAPLTPVINKTQDKPVNQKDTSPIVYLFDLDSPIDDQVFDGTNLVTAYQEVFRGTLEQAQAQLVIEQGNLATQQDTVSLWQAIVDKIQNGKDFAITDEAPSEL
jgi:hypothetical protein